jgi:hypothetical protein
MDVPWFMLSPSPVSLIQYAVLTWIMWGYLLNNVAYKKHPRIMSAIDGFFVAAFFVVLTDAFWVIFSLIKWLPLYPGDLSLLLMSLGRDLGAALLFGLFIFDHFKSGVLQWRIPVFWILISFVVQFLYFCGSSSPAFTDYTYAWRHGSDIGIIIVSWIFSHFILRIPLWIAIINTRRGNLK